MKYFWVSGSCRCFHDGVDDTKGYGLLLIGRWFLFSIGFKMTGEVPVQASVGLGVWGNFGPGSPSRMWVTKTTPYAR